MSTEEKNKDTNSCKPDFDREFTSSKDSVKRTRSDPPPDAVDAEKKEKHVSFLKRKISAPELVHSDSELTMSNSNSENKVSKKPDSVESVSAHNSTTDNEKEPVDSPQHQKKIQKSKSEDIVSSELYESDYYTPTGSTDNVKNAIASQVSDPDSQKGTSAKSDISPRHHRRVRHRSDGNLVYENRDVLDSVQEILMEEEKEWKRVSKISLCWQILASTPCYGNAS